MEVAYGNGNLNEDLHNPLMHPVIISKLLRYFSVQDLRSCRRVCKLWRTKSERIWSSRTVSNKNLLLVRKSSDCLNLHQRNGNGSLPVSNDEFYRVRESPHHAIYMEEPCLGYQEKITEEKLIILYQELFDSSEFNRVTHFHLKMGGALDLEILLEVLIDASPNLDSIVIENEINLETGHMLDGNIFSKKREFLHAPLKSLKLWLCHSANVCLTNCLSHFPALKVFHLHNSHFQLEDVLYALRTNECYRLNELGFRTESQEYSLNACKRLRDLRMPLESLNISFDRNVREEYIHEILEIHANTLKKLDMHLATKAPVQIFPHGVLFNLREVRLQINFIYHNLHFLSNMRNLQVVTIDASIRREKANFDREFLDNRPRPSTPEMSDNSNTIVLPHMKEFEYNVEISLEHLRKYVRWMPNLSVLRTALTNDGFAIVCGSLRALTEIELMLGTDLNDQGITGRCKHKACEGRYHGGIADLKCLKKFLINKTGWNMDRVKFSDEAVFHGFLLLPHLNTLTIYATSDMTIGAKNALLDTIPNVTIICEVDETTFGSRILSCLKRQSCSCKSRDSSCDPTNNDSVFCTETDHFYIFGK